MKTVIKNLLQSLTEVFYKVRQVLQSVADCCYKVCQVLQSMTGSYYKVRQVFQSVTVIVKWDVTPFLHTKISSIWIIRKWIYSLQFSFPSKAISERSFSALERLKTKIRSTTLNNRLEIIWFSCMCIKKKLSRLIFAR